MFGKRIRYLIMVLGLGSFYLFSGEWISCILLLSILALPVLSLLISIPAIRSFSLEATGGDVLEMDEKAELWLLGSSTYPLPPFQGNIHLRSCITGEERNYQAETGFDTAHCGGWKLSVEKPRVCDYMGLFSFRIRQTQEAVLIVRPKPLAIANAPIPQGSDSLAWRPKHGGGFAENHELREYRPGDNLNQVHWKLSAKTGSLIIREPMEPIKGTVLLTMTLRGDAAELDRKLGRLLWMGRHLLEHETRFDLRVLTGQGCLTYGVDSEAKLLKTLDTILCCPAAASGSVQDFHFDAQWQYHIGGAPDET